MSEDQELIIEPAAMSSARELVAAEIDVQVATAKQYPRSIAAFQASLLGMVTSSTAVAEQCEYSVPRDGKSITGPSARFAEMALCCFKNARVASRIVSIDAKFITAEGAFLDLENNAGTVVSVKRRITNKYGKTYGDDMIQTTAQAASSIARRNAILAGCPRALWEEAFEAARVAAEGTKDQLPVRRQRMVEAFEREFGVSPIRVFRLAGVASLDDIGAQKLKFLRNIFVALKDGDMTIEQAFAEPAAKTEGGLDGLADKPIPGREAKATAQNEGPEPPATAQEASQGTAPTEAPPEDLENRPAAPWGQPEAQTAPEADAEPTETPAENPAALPDAGERNAIIAGYRGDIARAVAKSRITAIRKQLLNETRLLDVESLDLLDDLKARAKELGIEGGGK